MSHITAIRTVLSQTVSGTRRPAPAYALNTLGTAVPITPTETTKKSAADTRHAMSGAAPMRSRSDGSNANAAAGRLITSTALSC